MLFTNRLLKHFFLFFAFIIAIELNAQSDIYAFKQISYEQGLPGVNVRNIFQDSRGVMWFSVEAMGICKYYGHKFVQYRNIPQDTTSLSSNFTNAVLEDPFENVWVATDVGLNRYDRDKDIFVRYFHSDKKDSSISDNTIHTLFIDSEGTLWVGTSNGLNKYDHTTGNFQHFLYKKDPALHDVWNIKAIYEGKSNFLWIGTNKGLLKFDTETNTYKLWGKSAEGGLSHNLINTLEGDGMNTLWIGTHRGINKFDLDEERFLPWEYKKEDQAELQEEGINHIYNDEEGNLWIGTYTRGIVKLNLKNEDYERITNAQAQQHGLKSNHIKYIFQDRTDAIWIATKFEGIFINDLNKTIFSNWPERYDIFLKIKDKHILDFYADPKHDSTYWVASKFYGLYRVDIKKNRITNYKHVPHKPTTINANRIHAIERDELGHLYIGSENGLDLFVEDQQEFDHISRRPVDFLKSDSYGNLWMGSTNGLFVFNYLEGVVKRHPSRHNFFSSNIKIRYIFEDSNKNLWFATDHNGLYFYDLQSDYLEVYSSTAPDSNRLSDDMIRPIFEDSQGNLWIGAKTNGLNVINHSTGKISHYTTRDGLPTNFILGIEEDPEGNLWISTHNGLSKFNPSTATFTNFNKEYGLQNNIFEINVNHNLGDGCLMFGGHGGFNIFNTDSINHKYSKPRLIFSSIKVMGQEIKRDVTGYEELVLDYRQNYLSFEFGLTDYSYPVKHRFAYKLEGLDKEWNLAGNRNFASYSSLAPDEYILKVKGANELGIWNNEGVQLKITIKPPFYDTWAFRIFSVVFLSLLGFMIYRNKTRKNKKTKRLLESKIKERTQKLQDALRELKDQQTKIESQNEELSSQYEKIVSQRDHIQNINDQLNKAHEELKEINSDLDKRVKERTEKLMKINQELDRFVYSASHDLSAPLKSILGLINIAKFENKDKSMTNNLDYMERSVKKLEEVIKSLTQFSRNMGHEVKKTNIRFDEIVEEILSESTAAYNTDGYDVVKDYRAGTFIYSDYLRLRIIFTNLISNAFKYKKTRETKPRLKISLLKEDDHYIIKIRDFGIGISKENQEKVFTMFYRATSQSEGSGLGLYIVTEILAKLDGTIEVQSVPGEFTEFTVKLPIIVD